MQTKKLFTLMLISTLSITAFAADDDAITPYRPSVSSPAQLPLAGQLEFEVGGLSSKTGDARRDSMPYQFKLAFNKEWGVLIGGEAAVSARDGLGGRERGFGDTSVVLKRAFLVNDTTAFGLEFGVKMPTAKDSIGSGKSDVTLNGIFSRDFNTVHMDSNLNVTRLGLEETGLSRTQTGLSTSFSMPVADHWNITTEFSGTHRSGTPNTAQMLAAFSYSPTKRLTMDFGVAKGLNDASQDWSLFAGLVVPLAKLW